MAQKIYSNRFEDQLLKNSSQRRRGDHGNRHGEKFQRFGNNHPKHFFWRSRSHERSETTEPLQVSQVPPSRTTEHYSIPLDGIPPGGRLQRFGQNWEKMTKHSWPKSVIQEGYRIQFVTLKSESSTARQRRTGAKESRKKIESDSEEEAGIRRKRERQEYRGYVQQQS